MFSEQGREAEGGKLETSGKGSAMQGAENASKATHRHEVFKRKHPQEVLKHWSPPHTAPKKHIVQSRGTDAKKPSPGGHPLDQTKPSE